MMELQDVIDYCSSKIGVVQDFPFDDTTIVFKIGRKMFALLSTTLPFRLNLKCDPVYAQIIRQQFNDVQPGYHMNKEHWNSLYLPGDFSDEDAKQWIDDSYALVIKTLTKRQRALQGLE